MSSDQVQNLSDDALEGVAGGGNTPDGFRSASRTPPSDEKVFAMEIAPTILGLCAMVKAGADRNTVWNGHCAEIERLIREKLPAGTRYDLYSARSYFDLNC